MGCVEARRGEAGAGLAGSAMAVAVVVRCDVEARTSSGTSLVA